MSIERTKEDQDRFHADMARIASLPVTKAIEAMERKPTAAATRAELAVSDAIASNPKLGFRERAEIIDRETGLPELIEACNALSVAESAMIGTEYGNELLHKAINLAKAGLRKAEGA